MISDAVDGNIVEAATFFLWTFITNDELCNNEIRRRIVMSKPAMEGVRTQNEDRRLEHWMEGRTNPCEHRRGKKLWHLKYSVGDETWECLGWREKLMGALKQQTKMDTDIKGDTITWRYFGNVMRDKPLWLSSIKRKQAIENKSRTLEMPSRTWYFRRDLRAVQSLYVAKQQ